ncbi:hypothetical protein Tco_0292550, partial [Tanacetum coccineum]
GKQLANACLQMLAYKCKLQLQAANACCKCLLQGKQPANACLQMQPANANANCKCLLQGKQPANACLQMLICKCKMQMQVLAAG